MRTVKWNAFLSGLCAVLVALGVVAGYALLGATYLIMKTEGETQQRSVLRARRAAYLMMAAAVVITVWTPLLHTEVARRWFTLPSFYYLAPLPTLALIAFVMLLRALHRGFETSPFLWSVAIFVTSFAGLAASLYPHIIPPGVTVLQAASSSKTLVFMLAGIGMLLPVMLIYNAYQYLVFRGKVAQAHYGEE